MVHWRDIPGWNRHHATTPATTPHNVATPVATMLPPLEYLLYYCRWRLLRLWERNIIFRDTSAAKKQSATGEQVCVRSSETEFLFSFFFIFFISIAFSCFSSCLFRRATRGSHETLTEKREKGMVAFREQPETDTFIHFLTSCFLGGQDTHIIVGIYRKGQKWDVLKCLLLQLFIVMCWLFRDRDFLSFF